MLTLLLTCCALLATANDGVAVEVTYRDGRTVEANAILPDLEFDTPDGRRAIPAARIVELTFGDVDSVIEVDGRATSGHCGLAFLQLTTEIGEAGVPSHVLRSLRVIGRAMIEPGTIGEGTGRNGVTYRVYVPEGYRPEVPHDCIIVFHGSNMSAMPYVRTMVQAWPRLGRRFIIIGVNGERRVDGSPDSAPRYNFTYVNYTGRSTFRGYPGSERESPALIAELLGELREALPIRRVFAGGHSQGGFLTFSLMMNHPELIDGAFAVSGGLIFQAEPTAFEDQEVIAAQRATPLAIVHGRNDTIVPFEASAYAFDAFADAAYPMVRLFTSDTAGHNFALLPLEDVITWLEQSSSPDAGVLLTLAERSVRDRRWRDAIAALQRAEGAVEFDQYTSAVARIERSITRAFDARQTELASQMTEEDGRVWIEAFRRFRHDFGLDPRARPQLEQYAELRAAQQQRGEELGRAARRIEADAEATPSDVRTAWQQVIDEAWASSWYPTARRRLAGLADAR